MAEVHRVVFKDGNSEAKAKQFLPRAAAEGLAPEIRGWGDGYVDTKRGIPLVEWFDAANDTARAEMRERVLTMILRLHALGICHRDFNVTNIVVIDGQPRAIDFEHAVNVDPTWPCYDMTGPSAQVPLLPAHAYYGGILGSTGMWWGAQWDRRFRNTMPLSALFDPP